VREEKKRGAGSRACILASRKGRELTLEFEKNPSGMMRAKRAAVYRARKTLAVLEKEGGDRIPRRSDEGGNLPIKLEREIFLRREEEYDRRPSLTGRCREISLPTEVWAGTKPEKKGSVASLQEKGEKNVSLAAKEKRGRNSC